MCDQRTRVALGLLIWGCLSSAGTCADELVRYLDIPPFGTRFPPPTIGFGLTGRQGGGGVSCFPFDYIGSKENDEVDTLLELFGHDFLFDAKNGKPPQKVEWSTKNPYLADGDVVPFAGQVYRWALDKQLRRSGESRSGSLVLIEKHPLALAPKDAALLWHLEYDLRFRLPQSNGRIWKISLMTAKFVKKQTSDGVIDAVDVDIARGDEDQLISPAHTNKGRVQLAAGELLETKQWALRVVRVVAPDPKQHIKGWADIRLERVASKDILPPKPKLQGKSCGD